MQETLGCFLKKLRTEQHFTQTQVARQLGITRQAYAYYENSSSTPDLEILIHLAALYQIPLQSFLNYCPGIASDQIAETSQYTYQAYEQDIYPEFMNFYSQQENMKKYHYLSRSEKKMLFLFQKLTEEEQEELLLWAYFKSSLHIRKHPLSASNPPQK